MVFSLWWTWYRWFAGKADQSSITEQLQGRIILCVGRLPNIPVVWSVIWQVTRLYLQSKATVAISSNTNSSDRAVGVLQVLVDQDAQIQDSYALKAISIMSSTLVESWCRLFVGRTSNLRKACWKVYQCPQRHQCNQRKCHHWLPL